MQQKFQSRYVVKIHIAQVHYNLSIKDHLKDAANAIDVEIPIDKQYYDHLSIGSTINDDFRVGSHFGQQCQASQPNPAIPVIEALEAARAELYQFVPITHVSILHKLTDAINSIKQIKP